MSSNENPNNTLNNFGRQNPINSASHKSSKIQESPCTMDMYNWALNPYNTKKARLQSPNHRETESEQHTFVSFRVQQIFYTTHLQVPQEKKA